MIRNIGVLAFILAGIVASPAAQLKEARVTEVIKEVKLLPSGAAPRPAAVSDEVRDGTAVRTGVESRSELKFPDQTLARLGANTVFSFSEGTRSLNLQDGAMLLRVPKGAGGARISSSAVTAAITGTTVMVEAHPVTQKRKNSYYKFIVLEGTARLFLPGQLGESVLVKAGQMIIMPLGGRAKKIPEAVDVDIQTIMQSSLLITGFGPLGSEQLIAFEQTRQSEQKTSGQLYETNLKIAGGGTNVILGDPNQVDVAVTAQKSEGSGPFATPAPTPTPTATPSKFGTPVPITSPDPYVITSGTTITTDPSITTNSVTNFGKIYQGAAIDGPASAWAFGSTSTFDTSSGFDSAITGSGAAFKFTTLQLAGNPTISTASGEINLGLIAVNGITSAAPGGVLTFAGIRSLLLAAQNGSIGLGPEISFSGLHDITLYARGAGSVLALASDISTTSDIRLYGENAILVTGNLSTQRLIAAAGENIIIGGGGSTTISASEASLLIPNSGSGNIPGSATIALLQAGNLMLNGSSGLSLTIDNTNGGHIGHDADIFLSTGGDLTASSLLAFLNDRDGGAIDSVANVSVAIGGNLTTVGDVTVGTSARLLTEGSSGGTIGSDVFVGLTANSLSAGGFFETFISTLAGGRITGNAQTVIAMPGDLSADAGILIPIYVDGFISINPLVFAAGGVIGGNASILLTAQNILTKSTASGTPGLDTMALEASIYTDARGSVGGNADVVVQAQQNISAPGTSFFTVSNGNFQGFGAGTIGGEAMIDVGAVNFSTGMLSDGIYNYGGGRIGNNASINLALSGDLAVQGDALFQILNFGNSDGLGHIGENASINVTAASIQAASLLAEINNSSGGQIGGSASINVSASGPVAVTNDATFRIDGSDGAVSAAININGGSYDAGGTFLAEIDGSGTITFNNASVHANVLQVGALGTNGVLNIGGGGTLSADTTLKLYALGSNGMLNFVGNVTLSSGTAANLAASTITIQPSFVVTIAGNGGAANVYTTNPNYAGFGGNNPANGTFGGNGANRPQPLANAPSFTDPASRAGRRAQTLSITNVTSAGRVNGGLGGRGPAIRVSDSSQLAALLDNASPGRDGKVRIASAAVPRTASAGIAPTQTSRVANVRDRHRSVDMNVGSKMVASRLP
jgi:FecR protein